MLGWRALSLSLSLSLLFFTAIVTVEQGPETASPAMLESQGFCLYLVILFLATFFFSPGYGPSTLVLKKQNLGASARVRPHRFFFCLANSCA